MGRADGGGGGGPAGEPADWPRLLEHCRSNATAGVDGAIFHGLSRLFGRTYSDNLEDPREGAAGTRFPRNVANAAITPEQGEQLLTPDPRLVSRRLLTRGETMREIPFLNLLAASWIQFQNHDWITHGENLTREIIELPLAEDDPARHPYHQQNMFVGRTINEVTHWWDGWSTPRSWPRSTPSSGPLRSCRTTA